MCLTSLDFPVLFLFSFNSCFLPIISCPVVFTNPFFFFFFFWFLCICTSAAPQRPAHGTVSYQVATHLRTDRVCRVLGRSWIRTQDYWFAVTNPILPWYFVKYVARPAVSSAWQEVRLLMGCRSAWRSWPAYRRSTGRPFLMRRR